jgi:hypothetical protein
MSQKLDKAIRKEVRKKMSHEFELLHQMMLPQPKNWLLSRVWQWGLKFYFKEEIDYNPSKRYPVNLPKVENDLSTTQKPL